MTDERRAIRVDRDHVAEARPFEYPWSISAKGNPWLRVEGVVLVVSPNKFHEGEWNVSFAIDGDTDANGKQNWQRLPPPNRFTLLEDAKRAALAALGVRRGARDEPEPEKSPAPAEPTDPGVQRRIRVD